EHAGLPAKNCFHDGSHILRKEEAVREKTNGDGFDVVFDETGYGHSMEKAFSFVAHGGALVLVSVVKDDISFSDPEFHKSEMMVIGSRNATRVDF
ncbi:zinc-binding dehydrogenase, partial [Rhizobium ruizarguesonis]